MTTRFYTNHLLYILQSKLASPNSQGNSRWIVVNPVTSSLYGAVGKDSSPELLKILQMASTSEGISSNQTNEALIARGLLTNEAASKHDNFDSFLPHYHEFVHGYRFNNYSSIDRFEKDRKQMLEYGKIQPPPPVYTPRNQDFISYTLPPPDMTSGKLNDEIQVISNVLSGTFLAVDLIDGGDFGPWLRKASPSGGARHPIEACIAAFGRCDIPDGIHYYDPVTNSLIKKLSYSPKSAGNEELTLILSAHIERPMWRYRESRSFRAVFIDAGHCIETINQLASVYGWSLIENNIPTALTHSLDLRDIPICAFKIKKEDCTNLKPSQHSENKIKLNAKDTDHIEYKTNPFLWCKFNNGVIKGTISHPKRITLDISLQMLDILSYTQTSKRGDRPSTKDSLLSRFNDEREAIDILIENGFLLSEDSVRELYIEARHWIIHGWYQNLLLYLEYLSSKRDSLDQNSPKVTKADLSYSSVELWNALSQNRKTTRHFSEEFAPLSKITKIISPLLDELTHDDKTELFQLIRLPDKNFSLEHLNKRIKKFTAIRIISREDVEESVIGQKPITQASNVFWITTQVNEKDPQDYFNSLLKLGILCQKLCIQCALENMGIFITPASNDEKASTMSEICSRKTINYFAAIGIPIGG